jgi:glycosyltransferase involved in cell wall biosynthesis
MNILFSTTFYHPYVSGLSLYIRRLASALALRSYHVNVLCMEHDRALSREETVDRVHITRANTLLPLSKGFLSFDFIIRAWQMVQDADVVIVNLPQFEGFWPAVFGKIQQKKVLAIYHSEIELPRGFINSVIQSLVEVANMCTLLLADTVITYTQDFADHSRLLRLVSGKVVTTFPPIPVPKINITLVKKLRADIGTADVVIGVAARLAAEKGLEYLFQAIPQIQTQMKNKSIKVVIAGPDNPVGEQAYRQKIRQLEKQYKQTLVFLGALNPEDMGSFYSLLDVLVLPSVNSTETFGMVQVEAMMTGVPVVASDLPGVRVPIQKTSMGVIVPPKDVSAIASAIGKIIKNKSQYTVAKDIIVSLFGIERTVSFYEALFID